MMHLQVFWLHADDLPTLSSAKPDDSEPRLSGHCLQLHGGPRHPPAAHQGHSEEGAVSNSSRLNLTPTETEPRPNSLLQHGHQRVWVRPSRLLIGENGPHTLQGQCVHV